MKQTNEIAQMQICTGKYAQEQWITLSYLAFQASVSGDKENTGKSKKRRTQSESFMKFEKVGD